MLVIPNTTTTARETDPGAAVFPPGGNGLTGYAEGYLIVANNPAQIAIAKGADPSSVSWTPYALVAPVVIPLSTDRGGRNNPDLIYGVKAIDGVAGTHAQVFGVLYQPGEAGFIPSQQFVGTVSPSGGFTPPSTGVQLIAYGGNASAGLVLTPALTQIPSMLYNINPPSPATTLIVATAAFSVAAGDATVLLELLVDGAEQGQAIAYMSDTAPGPRLITLPVISAPIPLSAAAHTVQLAAAQTGGTGTASVGGGIDGNKLHGFYFF